MYKVSVDMQWTDENAEYTKTKSSTHDTKFLAFEEFASCIYEMTHNDGFVGDWQIYLWEDGKIIFDFSNSDL